jgi:hypothetical protein
LIIKTLARVASLRPIGKEEMTGMLPDIFNAVLFPLFVIFL